MSGTTMTSLRRRLKRVSSRVSEVELKTAMVIKGGVLKGRMALPTDGGWQGVCEDLLLGTTCDMAEVYVRWRRSQL